MQIKEIYSSSPAAFAPGSGSAVGLLLPLLPLPPPVRHHVGPLPFPLLLQVPPPVGSIVLRLSLPKAQRTRRLLPLPLLLPLLRQVLHLLRLLRLRLRLLVLLLPLLLVLHLDRPLLILTLLLRLLLLAEEVLRLALILLPLLKIPPHLPVAVPLVELLKLLNLLPADHVPIVIKTGPELRLLSVEHVSGF